MLVPIHESTKNLYSEAQLLISVSKLFTLAKLCLMEVKVHNDIAKNHSLYLIIHNVLLNNKPRN